MLDSFDFHKELQIDQDLLEGGGTEKKKRTTAKKSA